MSSLLEPDFSLIPSETVDSTTDYSRKSAPVWEHSRCPNPDENQALLYCKHCKLDTEKLLYSASSFSSITKHIIQHYKDVSLKKGISKNQEAVNKQMRQLYH